MPRSLTQTFSATKKLKQRTLFGMALMTASALHADAIDVIILEGDPAIGGGNYVISGASESGSLIGDYASFTASRDAPANTDIALLSNKTSNSLDIVFEGGQSIDNLHSIKTNGLHSIAGSGTPVTNNQGQVIMTARAALTSNGNADKDDLVFGDQSGYIESIVYEDQPEPNGNGDMRMPVGPIPAINASGQVAASVRLANTTGGAADDEAIFQWDGTSLTKIVRKGDSLPSGPGIFTGTTFQSNDIFAAPFINTFGDIAFIGGVDGGVSGESNGIFVSSAGFLFDYVRYNYNLPNGEVFSSVRNIDFNDSGEVAFSANWQGTSSSTDGIYRANGLTITELGATGQTSPNGSPFRIFQNAVKLANDGTAIFSASLTETPVINTGVFIGDGSSTTQLAKTTNPAPEARGDFTGFSRWQISRGGQVAFQATTSNAGFEAIYRLDSNGQIAEAISTADSIDGSAITVLSLMGSDDGQAIGVNDDGDILFGFTLANGKNGVALWRLSGIALEPVQVPALPLVGLGVLSLMLACVATNRRHRAR